MLKRWLQKAQEIAERHIPDEVREEGKRLAGRVLERAPERLRNAARPLLGGDAAPEEEGGGEIYREYDATRTEPLVVVFGYPEDPVTQRVWALFAEDGIEARRMNLHQQPDAARQIAGVTGVMVPPYVYIRGRFWGSEGEIVSLRATGDLARVVAGDLDAISDEARRIGKILPEFDDAFTVENIVARLRLGHIVAMDDLDCWCEVDPASGEERVFYEGSPRPLAELAEVAADLAARVDAGEVSARWLFEPEVSLH